MKRILSLVLFSFVLSLPAFSEETKVLLLENFSEKSETLVENEICTYKDGEYYMNYHKEEGNLYYSWTGDDFTDFSLSVKARKIKGPDNWGYGLVFRHQGDVDNTYEFAVSGNGMYYIGKVVGGDYKDIVPWTNSSDVQQGNATNELTVTASGSSITVFINGVKQTTITDNAFSSGRVGLLTYSDVETAFDDFKVESAPAGPTVTFTKAGQVLLSEDFSRKADTFVDDEFCDYKNGEYVMHYKKKEGDLYYSWSGDKFNDFVFEAKARKIKGPENWGYGLVFRLSDEKNTYEFAVSGNGMYYVGKTVNGDYADIVPWTFSSAVKQGNSTNKLAVEAKGDEFSFYVNGVYLTSLKDNTFSSGKVGFLDYSGVLAAFDDAKVHTGMVGSGLQKIDALIEELRKIGEK